MTRFKIVAYVQIVCQCLQAQFLLCLGLGSFQTARTASACPASASGGRPSSSSTRSSAPAQSAGTVNIVFGFPSRQLFAFFWFWNNVFGCRQTSDYICPSRFWVETTEEKGRLLTDYKVISLFRSLLYKKPPMVCENPVRVIIKPKLLQVQRSIINFLPQKNLGQKECKYFNKGVGECPFGNKCFYQHADKDGRSAV